MKHLKKHLWVIVVLLVGVLVRMFLFKYGLESGKDISSFAEWGDKYWVIGAKNFYTAGEWFYTFPTHLPPSMLMFAALRKLYDYHFVLSQIHNTFHIIPAVLLVNIATPVPLDPFMYTYGYYFLLKIPALLGDIGLALLIYYLVSKYTEKKYAVAAAAVYFLNPITIFITGVWGQYESFVALFGMLGFYFAFRNKLAFSMPFFALSLLLKPTWFFLIPLYLYLLWRKRREVKGIVLGIVFAFGVYVISTMPFTDDLVSYSTHILFTNILPTAKGTSLASVSAFNLHSVFHTIDVSLAGDKYLFLPASFVGIVIYIVLIVLSIRNLKRDKMEFADLMFSMFLLGIGGYLFMTNMLERYFFAGFVPLVLLIFLKPKLARYLVVLMVVFFLNLVWAYYRRDYIEFSEIFTSNYYLGVRLLSLSAVVAFLAVLYKQRKLDLR